VTEQTFTLSNGCSVPGTILAAVPRSRVPGWLPRWSGVRARPGEAVVDCGRHGGAAPGLGFLVGLVRPV